MIRVLTILATIVALAVSASPASAGWQKPKPAPSIKDGTSNTVQFRNAAKGRSAGKVANHTEGTVSVVGDRRKLLDDEDIFYVRGIFAGHYRDGQFAGR
jgi:hypothetical protein